MAAGWLLAAAALAAGECPRWRPGGARRGPAGRGPAGVALRSGAGAEPEPAAGRASGRQGAAVGAGAGAAPGEAAGARRQREVAARWQRGGGPALSAGGSQRSGAGRGGEAAGPPRRGVPGSWGGRPAGPGGVSGSLAWADAIVPRNETGSGRSAAVGAVGWQQC